MKLEAFGVELVPNGKNYDSDWTKRYWGQLDDKYSLCIWLTVYNKNVEYRPGQIEEGGLTIHIEWWPHFKFGRLDRFQFRSTKCQTIEEAEEQIREAIQIFMKSCHDVGLKHLGIKEEMK